MVASSIAYRVQPYIDRQLNLTLKVRAILMEWMMEVCEEFMLKRETFHFAANYVDRYLLEGPSNLAKNKF